jgi:D-arabinose 1-dehydrogenase-like Zn-dependent alcohol dehydrogenase
MLEFVRPDGRVAYPNGVEPEPKRRRKHRIIAYDAVAGQQEFSRLKRAAEEARLRVPMAAVFPLSQASRAHERLERRHILGRIALRVRAESRNRKSTGRK